MTDRPDDNATSPNAAPETPAPPVPPEADHEEGVVEAAPAAEQAKLVAELAETKDALLRAHAEMDNLRKRTAREIDEARRYAVTSFARDLLEVSDNLARAVSSIPAEVRESEGWAANLAVGVDMTERALLSVFEKHRISRVEPAKGERFDHQRHQAMFEVATAAHPPGTIAEVMAVGYTLDDRLLRPAMVGVAKAPAPQPSGTQVDEQA